MKSFSKEERLCSRRLLDLLFKNGSSFLLYPYRVSHLFVPEKSIFSVKVVINVSKKRYKRAVDRNLIKRLTREAYRTQKQSGLYSLLDKPDYLLLLSLQFIGKEKYSYSFLEKKMSNVLRKLLTNVS